MVRSVTISLYKNFIVLAETFFVAMVKGGAELFI